MALDKNFNRRSLLRAGGLVGGALLAPALPSGVSAKTPEQRRSPLAKPALGGGQRGLAALAKDFEGRLLLPGDAAYAVAAWPNAGRWSTIRPLAIAMCGSSRDVERSIRWAREARVEVAIRSGGHNYAGFSTTPGLLIDVKPMADVTYDLDKGTARVAGGAANQDMAGALQTIPFAVPSGRCPTVGTSGLVLGGGWGFSATHAGLTCDSLIETDIVMADGRTITTNATSEPDLFWALRGGGGGNFGVNTAFTFKLHPVHDVITFNLAWPPGKQIELMTALQTMQQQGGTDISTRTKIVPQQGGAKPPRDQLGVQTLGLFWGSETQLRELLAPAYRLARPNLEQINRMDYWSARTYLLTDDPVGLYDIRPRYVAGAMSEQGLDTMMTWMSKWPGGSLLQENMGILFAIGGVVKDKAPTDTAYVHRTADYIFEMETSWGPIDGPDVVRRQQDWLSAYFDAMQPYVLPESYVNFPNRDLPHWADAYYGRNLPRLSTLKGRYDSDDFFHFAQSIPPAK